MNNYTTPTGNIMKNLDPDDIKRWFDEILPDPIKWKGYEGVVKCPFKENHQHGDKHPSFSVNAEKGTWHCFAENRGGGIKDLCEQLRVDPPWKDIVTPMTLPRYPETGDTKGRKSNSISYLYRDEKGNPLYKVNRNKKEKKFYQQSWNETQGKWTNKQDKTPVPYMLPELLKGIEQKKVIFITEGERDCDNLHALELVATTNSGGAGKWKKDHSQWFKKDTQVVILPDHDKPGQSHAQIVAKSLHERGCQVKVLDLGYEILSKHGKDVSDWLEDGNTKEDLFKLIKDTPEWNKQQLSKMIPNTFSCQRLLKMEIPEPRWILPGILPEGATILAGKPKGGKSLLMLNIAFAVSIGGMALGKLEVEQGEVLYLDMENPLTAMKQRVMDLVSAQNLDIDKVSENLIFADREDWPKLHEGGLEAIEAWIECSKNPALIVVDTLQAMRPPTNTRRSMYEQDYEAVSTLQKIAGKNNIAIVVIHHTNKMIKPEDDPIGAISGTMGISGGVDSVMVLSKTTRTADSTLYCQGRYAPAEELALNQTNIGWSLLGKAEDCDISPEQAEILNVIEQAGEPVTPSEIAKKTGKGRTTINDYLRRLSNNNKVVKIGRGKYAINNNISIDLEGILSNRS
jgi:5S rRNA maturation endonuclease (ribonuclease M5)